ncbi:MAG TPA: RluA family pseudouridine synthase [Bryobacteraceae bacterium]|nr:RluA family pseudouridine synthase [Bryobacteraceae bacterium]
MTITAHAEDAGKRIDRFLQERLPGYSRARMQEWIRAGRVRIDGKPQKPSFHLRGGETLEVEPAELTPLRAEPEPIPLEILYEDGDVVAVNKPAGMVVHAGAGCRSGTLVNALLARFGALSGAGGQLRPGIVHRLDRYTSGVILVARHDAAHRDLARQFADRRVEKVYLALVHGAVKQDQGKIERPISRDPVRRVRMTARLGRGRTASTEYRVLRRYRDFTLLEVRIGTGRTHQIRVHMAAAGHPVAGDRLYGAPARVAAPETAGRFFLHSHRIRFSQPSSQAAVTVEAPLPAELERWLAGLL